MSMTSHPASSEPARPDDPWPPAIENEQQLDRLLTRPSRADVAFMQRLKGDVLLLGVGGKMGPSLARRIRRASDAAGVRCRVLAVSRFTAPGLAESLERDGVEVKRCDLLDPSQVDAIPTFENVIFLAGMKFGATETPGLTWVLNTVVAANVARRFGGARTVVFSTGNVYPPVDPGGGGCRETDSLGPVGEYAQSCLGRERIFEHFSRELTTPCVLYRLFYAVDLRYGVPVDVARRVMAGDPVDLTVPCFNAVWQGDALSYALRCLDLCECPPRALNVTGPDILSVKALAERFARRFGREPHFQGDEGRLALLGNAGRCHELLGRPEVSTDRLVDWVASWVETGGRSLGKPTGFEKADGRF